MGLIFFIAASRVLCFRFATKTVLKAHQCYSYCMFFTASRPSLFLTVPSSDSGLWVGKKLGGDTSGTADLKRPKGYPMPYNIMLIYRNWGGSFSHIAVSPRLLVGGGEWLPLHHVPPHPHSLVKLSLSLPTSYFCFCSSSCLPHCTGGEGVVVNKQLVSAWLQPGVNPLQHKILLSKPLQKGTS